MEKGTLFLDSIFSVSDGFAGVSTEVCILDKLTGDATVFQLAGKENM